MKNKTEYNQTPIKTFHIQLPTSLPFFEFLIFNFRHYVFFFWFANGINQYFFQV